MPEQPQTDPAFPNNDRELPRYKCHKEVHALKIKSVVPASDLSESEEFKKGSYLIPERSDLYGGIYVDEEWIRSRQPEAPGYYVVYEDGYTSWSPVRAFEKGYTLILNQ